MRGTYFHGCSGFVKIERGLNDRVPSEITITNFQYDLSTDTFSLKLVGSFNPFSTQPYQITSPLQWPDDMPRYADSKPYYEGCPFLAETVQELPYSGAVGISISVFLCVYTLVMSLAIWKSKGRTQYPLLQEKSPMSLEDFLVLTGVCLDYFQLAVLGPNLEYLSSSLQEIYLWLSLDIPHFPSVTGEVYWVVVGVALGLVYFWVLICVLALIGCNICCELLEFWTEVLMPTFWFMPLVAALISVFQCAKSVSGSLTDSVFDTDCTEFCWQGKHLSYAIASGLGLILYLPLAALTRIRWQDMHICLHAKARVEAILAKTSLEVWLIVSFSAFREDVHAYVSLSALLLYLMWILLVRQYNYARLNMWQVLLTLALLSLSLIAHLSRSFIPSVAKYLLLAILGEYLVLAGLGLLLQTCVPRFASKLIRKRSKDVRGLFRFAFTFGRRAYSGLQHYYASNHSDSGSDVIVSDQAIAIELAEDRR